MNFLYNLKYQAVIRDTASRLHMSPEDVQRNIQDALDDAWENGNRKMLQELFPDGKPSPAQFVFTLAKYVDDSDFP